MTPRGTPDVFREGAEHGTRGACAPQSTAWTRISKALAYAEANPQLVPPYLDVPEFRKDFNLALTLQAILQISTPLQESIADTARAAGHEAYRAALVFYQTAQQAAELNVPGADTIADDLGERFAGQGTTTPPAPPNPPNP